MGQAYQPLHHKYRPQRLSELVGQEAIAATLTNALGSGRIAPAYLFSGPRGTGKTSSARILARSLNCISSPGPTPEPCGKCELCTSIAAGTALDVIEIDAASNTGVDNIRELIERSRFSPVQARWKVYVIDECHMLSTAAFNALLKTLEEPPPQVVFVLATTDPQRVLPTILSRCQRFDFRRIPLGALEGHLGWIAGQEAIEITPEALHLVAQRAQGGLRDAESLLDQLSLLPAPIEPTAVWELLGAVPEQELLTLAAAMAESEPLTLVEACRDLLDRGREPAAVLQGLASLLRDLLLSGVAPERLELTAISPQLRDQLPPLARRIGKARLLHWQAQLRGSEQQLRLSIQPRLWLEVLLLGLLAEPLQAKAQPGVAAVPNTAASPAAALSAGSPASASTSAASASPQTAPRPAAPPPPQAAAAITTAATAPAGEAIAEPAASTTDAAPNLPELWQRILASLELPSTRMLLNQQAQLVRLDQQRAVVRVASTWMAMVQSRLPLLEQALNNSLGGSRQVVLEAGAEPPRQTSGPSSAAAPAAAPAAVPVAAPQEERPPAPLAASAGVIADSAGVKTSAPPPPIPAGPATLSGSPAQPGAPPASPSGAPQTTPARERLEAPAPAPTPSTPAAEPGRRSPLDDKARRLADFFNGELIEADAETLGLADAADQEPSVLDRVA
ncbi:MAG: DNA polymerase III subunit gamma/tau [Synechococcaceae cyanobacterium]|nr:DNA polymerase III subunit gamma/tau [Synechococcaceae cyanobacterium]